MPMADQFPTVELKLVVKVKDGDVGWIEEAIRQGFEDGEDILELSQIDN